MTDQLNSVFTELDKQGANYRQVDHQAAYTIEDMQTIELGPGELIAKNLFLRDARGKKHFLLCLPGDKPVDLKHLRTIIGSSQLSFASAERLKTHLNLEAGAVTPFGVINNEDNHVTVYFDKELAEASGIGFHPNTNTATVFVSLADALTFVKNQGNSAEVLTF